MDISPHITLERIVRFPRDPLSVSEAAEVLGDWSTSAVSQACHDERIEAAAVNFKGRGSRNAYRITKAALIRFIFMTETGSKEQLRAAMLEMCPRVLRSIERTPTATSPTPTPKAANVVAFEHPDLFRDLPRRSA